MGGSDNEGSLKKEKKEKKDKDKDKDKHEKKDKGKDKDKDEKKEKKDKDGGEKKDKDKKEKGKEDKGKDEKGKDKEKDKDKKEKDKKDKKDEDEDEEDGKKKKKDKDKEKPKDKDKKDKPSQPSGTLSGGPVVGGEAANYLNPSGAPPSSLPPLQLAQPSQSGETLWFLRGPGPPQTDPPFPNPNPQYTSQQPLPQQFSRAIGDSGVAQPLQNVPPSGYRIPLDPNTPFPSPDQLGRPPTTDFSGSTGPVFIGSAIFPDSVQPCKITPSLHPPCRVAHNGSEFEHHGRFDLLPITKDMEWVPTRNGQIPPGRRPVEGGYESGGGKLYHALGSIQGVHVPGKAGLHLVSRFDLCVLGRGLTVIENFQGGASIPFQGSEHHLREDYSIL